jgi:hypothetical protein
MLEICSNDPVGVITKKNDQPKLAVIETMS